MKIFKLFAVALVAMIGLNSCSDDCDHVADNHSSDIVGTWTCFEDNFAQALVIKADGSFVSTGLIDGNYWENVAGNIVIEDGNVTLTFENGTNIKGHIDIIPGKAISIHNEEGGRFTFNYCANDLADEIVGVWVCNTNNNAGAENQVIHNFKVDGTSTLAGSYKPEEFEYEFDDVSTYKVVGDLMFQTVTDGDTTYIVNKLSYVAKGTSLGDIMTASNNLFGERNTWTWLRVKEGLDLSNKTYDYSDIVITDVSGKDIDFEFAGHTLNFSTLDGTLMDKMMKNILFGVSFISSEKISYFCYYNGKQVSIEAPIEVDGNKITIKMSEKNPVYQDIIAWAFQDNDNSQLHMYMQTASFEKFLANIAIVMMAKNGDVELTDEVIKQIQDFIKDAVLTINTSFIFKTSTKLASA